MPATPRWNGEDIGGKTLLLIAEQGLGDTIQFLRFAPMLAARGARVVVQASPQWTRLIATAPGISAVTATNAPHPPHDLHLPLPSVCAVLGIDAANIPAAVPYLRVAEEERRRAVIDQVTRLAGGAAKIGISWAGARHNTNDRRRSCPLVALASLFELDGIAWFSLQKGDGEEQIANVAGAARLAVLDARNDLDGTAALISALDLVISVDTSIAHLSGALGRPTWILLPFAPDWRWRVAGSESAWYPTVRLFRQPSRGDWAGVVRDVQARLVDWIARR